MAENDSSEKTRETLRLAMTHHQEGRLEEAAKHYREILDIAPDHADANHLFGIIASQQGDNETAARHISIAIDQAPDEAVYHNNLGNVLKDLGRTDEAIQSYATALGINPNLAEAHYNAGSILAADGHSTEAIEHFTKALDIKPDYIEAHGNLGNVLKNQGRLNDAVDCYQRAIALNPDLAEVLHNLGNAVKDLGRLDEAIAYFHESLALNPALGEVHNSLANAYKEQSRLDDAVASYNTALTINPDDAEALGNLASALTDLGELDSAIELYEKSLATNPDHPDTANNYLHALLYLPGLSNEALFNKCKETAGRSASPLIETEPTSAPTPKPGARLRIGYLSSDFRAHPVGHNVTLLFGNHDHSRFEIFCYAQLTRPDEVSEQFMRYADHWRATIGLTDAQIAEHIRADGIDIMVYLGGHFDKNRLSVASHRPAPIQVAMHGGTTTGLDEMDFWLTDPILHPAGGTTERFTEELIRLPAFYSYPRNESAPPVSALPAEDNGFITFASFNKPSKLNKHVIDLWSKVLLAIPDSRLKLKFKNFLSVPTLSCTLRDQFDANGIAPERVSLICADDSFQDHLAQYGAADIALDPFPFNGATTTFQALWMGVPVISLLGDRFISRAGASILTHAGLDDLIAETPEDYVDKAAALAADFPRLRELRPALRGRVSASPLCDGPSFATNVEKAFLKMRE